MTIGIGIDPTDSHAGTEADGTADTTDTTAGTTAGAIDAPTQVIDSVPSAKE